jgi:hypothetical protein
MNFLNSHSKNASSRARLQEFNTKITRIPKNIPEIIKI